MSSTNAVNRISADDYIPKRFGLKYSPPVIILEYLVPSTGKLFHHKMKLDFLRKDSDTAQAVKAIQLKHAAFFEKDKITQDQIAKLVNKMKTTLKSGVPQKPHRSKEKEILQSQQYSPFLSAEPKVSQPQVLNGNYMPNYTAKQAWPSPIQKHLPHQEEEDTFSAEKSQKGTIAQFNTLTSVQRKETSNTSSNASKPKEITSSYVASSSNKENSNNVKNINNNAAANSQASRNSSSITTSSSTKPVQQQQKPSVAPSKAASAPMANYSIEEEFKPFDLSDDDDDSETEKNIRLPAKAAEIKKINATPATTTKAISTSINKARTAVPQASPKNEILSKVKSPRTATGSYAQKKQKSFGFEDISEDESKDEEEEDQRTNPAAKQTTEEYDEDFEHYEEEFESSVEKPSNPKQNNQRSLTKVEDIDYHNTDLNKMTDEELKKHKAQMDINFMKNQKKPGDEGFEYDKRETFIANQSNEWDEEF